MEKYKYNKKNICCHYGDNLKSDYINPKKNNIDAFHIKDTKLNNNEKNF